MGKLGFYEIHPAAMRREDVVCVYGLGFHADWANSKERLINTAIQVGALTVVVDASCQNEPRRVTCDTDYWKRQSDAVLTHLDEKYPGKRAIGIGHSLAALCIAEIQRHGEEPPFATVGLADGFNLRAPQRALPGYAYFLGYTIVDGILGGIKNRPGQAGTAGQALAEELALIREHPAEVPSKPFLRQMSNLGPLMCGPRSRVSVVELAGEQPDLRLHVHGYTHGLSGPYDRLLGFYGDIKTARNTALPDSNTFNNLSLTVGNGWHSDLINPPETAKIIQHTLALHDGLIQAA